MIYSIHSNIHINAVWSFILRYTVNTVDRMTDHKVQYLSSAHSLILWEMIYKICFVKVHNVSSKREIADYQKKKKHCLLMDGYEMFTFPLRLSDVFFYQSILEHFCCENWSSG